MYFYNLCRQGHIEPAIYIPILCCFFVTAINMRNYKRTTTRLSWSEESIRGAIQEVLSNNIGYKRAAQAHNVPRSALEDRVKRARLLNVFSD